MPTPSHSQRPDQREVADRRHETVELAGHEQLAVALGDAVGRHHRQIDEDARQAEEAGEPDGHEKNVQRLDFEVEHQAFLSRQAALIPSATCGKRNCALSSLLIRRLESRRDSLMNES